MPLFAGKFSIQLSPAKTVSVIFPPAATVVGKVVVVPLFSGAPGVIVNHEARQPEALVPVIDTTRVETCTGLDDGLWIVNGIASELPGCSGVDSAVRVTVMACVVGPASGACSVPVPVASRT